MHYDKLTDEQKERMSKNGETSGKGGKMPKRTLLRKFVEEKKNVPLPRGSESVKRVDRKLAKALISSNASWALLDNPEFGDYSKEVLNGRYSLPTCGYMLDNVINPMFQETKEDIKYKLKTYIGLTTDAWTSMAQSSFITITAHILDEEF